MDDCQPLCMFLEFYANEFPVFVSMMMELVYSRNFDSFLGVIGCHYEWDCTALRGNELLQVSISGDLVVFWWWLGF